MPLFIHAMRTGLRGTVLFSVALAAVGSFYLSFFHSFQDMLSAKSDMMKSMPQGVTRALGIEDLSTGAAYAQATFLGLLGFVLLIAAATVWSASVSAGPEESGELELTISHGVSRTRVLLERTLAALARLLVLALVALATLAAWNLWGSLDIAWAQLPAGVAAWLGLGVLSAAAGIAAGAIVGRRMFAIGASVGIAVLGYMLNMVGLQSPDTEGLLTVSPYAWAFHHTPLSDGWDGTGLALLYGISAALILVAVLVFSRRDIGR